jgi:metallo-beta-lactamase family protein
MDVTLTAFGAAEEVTGSKHLLDAGHVRVLVDCGLFQGHREEAHRKNLTFPFQPSAVDACVNTHGHLDHCGAYPLLARNGYGGSIFSTAATRDIARLVLEDSARIQAGDARFLEKQHRKAPRPGRRVFPPLYDAQDVQDSMDCYIPLPYGQTREVARGVRAALFDAGHILGSSLVRFELDRGPAVGFTGDLGRPDLPLLRDPELLPPVDYLVCESTYGDRLHDALPTAEEDLAEVVRSAVAKGGRVLIPAFAVERTQELIYFLHRLHNAGRIPTLPVFVDSPMAVSATAIFRAHEDCYDAESVKEFLDNGESPFSFDALRYLSDAAESKKLNDLREPCIIISSSGMCEAGRILHHLVHGIGDERNTVLIVGFMAQNTLGRALADKLPEVRIFGERHTVRAKVKILNAFSAHADYGEIGDYVQRLDRTRLKGIFLVHGEPSAQAALRLYLASLGLPEPTILKFGEPVTLS